MLSDVSSACAVAFNGDLRGVAAEPVDVFRHPVECHRLVMQPVISWEILALATQETFQTNTVYF